MTFVYTASLQEGIQVARFSEEAGVLSAPSLAAPGDFFFLVRHPALRVLYAVCINSGRVKAYAIGAGGSLALLSDVDSGGAAPCHLVVDPAGGFLAVANYQGGVVRFPLDAQGRIGAPTATFQPEGSGPNLQRQNKPYPHGLAYDVRHSLLHVADLGSDKIWALDTSQGGLNNRPSLAAQAAPGAGPRHLAFSPDGQIALVANELDNTLSLFTRSSESGALENRRDFSMLPTGFHGTTHAAEVVFHPTGRACYATNRGHHSVVTFAVNVVERSLQSPRWLQEPDHANPEHVLCNGRGDWLAVAWRVSNRVTFHKINPSTLEPEPASASLTVSQPMCVLFIEDGEPDPPVGG